MTKDERAALLKRVWKGGAVEASEILALIHALDAAERRAEEARATALEEAAVLVATHATQLPQLLWCNDECIASWRAAMDAILALAAKEAGS